MTQRTPILLALVLVLASACKPAAPVATPEPAAAPPQAAASPANPVDATAVVDNTAASGAGPAVVDSKAIAGRFGDGESVLELRADGAYVQTLAAAGNVISSDGSWSATGKGLLLDPNSKSAEDVRLVVVSNDELSMDDGKHVFRRIAAGK